MVKRSIAPKRSRGPRRFDPVEFLETAAKGRIISTHPEKKIIFAQDGPRTAGGDSKTGEEKGQV